MGHNGDMMTFPTAENEFGSTSDLMGKLVFVCHCLVLYSTEP